MVPVLFAASGSGVVEAIVAELLMRFPLGTVTWTTNVKATPLFANVGVVAVTFPVPPTAGVVMFQPPGALNDTNVVPVGTASVSDTVCASDGPMLTAWIV